MARLPPTDPAPQAFEPFLVLRRRDGSYAVAARSPDGSFIELAPLRLLPPPPRRRLYDCPHCGRFFVLSEWADGRRTLEKLTRPHDDDGEDEP